MLTSWTLVFRAFLFPYWQACQCRKRRCHVSATQVIRQYQSRQKHIKCGLRLVYHLRTTYLPLVYDTKVPAEKRVQNAVFSYGFKPGTVMPKSLIYWHFLLSYWCHAGVTLVSRWCHAGVTLVLRWCYAGVKPVLRLV